MDKIHVNKLISVFKIGLFCIVLFSGLFVGNKVVAQDCLTYFPGTGIPSGGLTVDLCSPQPGFIELNATTPTTITSIYLWNTGASSSVIFPTMGGMYTVTVSSGTLTDSCILDFVVKAHPNPVINLGNDTSFCIGDTLVLRAPAGQISYVWTGGLTNDSILVTTPGTYGVTMVDMNTCSGFDTIVITQDTLPIVSLRLDTTVCVNDSVTINAGSGFSTYLWSTGETTQIIGTRVNGTYDVTVADANLCKGTDQFVLSNHIMPTVSIGANDSMCIGNTKTLDAGAGFVTYLWSDASTIQTTTFSITSDPWVKITDGNGCVGTDTMHLEIYNLPNLYLGSDDSICASQGFTLNAGNSGGKIISYLWSTGATNQTIPIVPNPSLSNNIVVDYSVFVTDLNGCENRDTMTLSTFVLPSPNMGKDTSFCLGQPFSISITPGTYNAYLWSTGASTASITVGAINRSYSVTVTDANGCMNSDDLTVTENLLPTPNLGPDDSYCEGSSFTKILKPGFFSTYLWNDNSQGQVLGVSSAGTYSVTVTDSYGCMNDDAVIITENPIPIVDLGNDVTYCEDQTVSLFLDATGSLVGVGYDFLWNTPTPPATTGTIIATNFGIQRVIVMDQITKCFASSSMEIIAMEKADPDLGDDGVVCHGQLVNLNPKVTINGYNYLWSTGATTNNINVFETGTYWVKLDAINGTCMGLTDTVTYTSGVLPVVELGADQYICIGQNVTLLGSAPFPGADYLWQDGTTQTSFVATETGDYEVSVSNECGAVVDQVYLEFQDCGNVYLPNSFTPNDDGKNDIFYPTTDQEFSEYGFWIYDRWGTLVFKTNIPKTGWDGKVNGKPAAVGTYVWKISYVSSFQGMGERIERSGHFMLVR